MLERHVDVDVLFQLCIGERQHGVEVLQGHFVLPHLAVDVGQREVNFFVVRLKRKEVLQPRNGLNVFSVACQNLGFSQLQAQTFGVEATGIVMHLLCFADGTALEVMLDEQLQFIVVEEPRFTRFHHGFKSLGQCENLVFSFVWTSFFVHSLLKYAPKVGRRGVKCLDFEQETWKKSKMDPLNAVGVLEATGTTLHPC